MCVSKLCFESAVTAQYRFLCHILKALLLSITFIPSVIRLTIRTGPRFEMPELHDGPLVRPGRHGASDNSGM